MEPDLDAEQLAAVCAPLGAVRVLAGAGTGKTTTVVARIARLVNQGLVLPEHVLALTFNARAAAELTARLRLVGVHDATARTFHSHALRQLRFMWDEMDLGPQPGVLAQPAGLLRDALMAAGATSSKRLIDLVQSERSWAARQMVDADQYASAAQAAGRAAAVPTGLIEQVLVRYEHVKQQLVVWDFDDILQQTVALLTAEPSLAQQARDAYRHLYVDEYQDVDPVQQRLLQLWVGPPGNVRDGLRDLVVVGDDHQSIYTFRGATPRYLLEFPRSFPACVTVALTRSYRLTEAAAQAANAALRPGPARELRGQRGAGQAAAVHQANSPQAEVDLVVGEVMRLLGPDPVSSATAGDIAVLCRTRALVQEVSRSLSAAGVAVAGGLDPLFERPVVLAVCRELAVSVQDADDDDGAHLLRTLCAEAGWDRVLEKSTCDEEDAASLTELVALVEAFPGAELLSGRAVLAALREVSDAAASDHADGVTVCTIHQAKGLQWDHVLLPGTVDTGCEQGSAAWSEELRLFYVAVTRALCTTTLSWSARREDGRAQRPSPFLVRLQAATAAGQPAQPA